MASVVPGALFIHGVGLLECLRCGRQWTQENAPAAWCCGGLPAIYDDAYREFVAWLEEHG